MYFESASVAGGGPWKVDTFGPDGAGGCGCSKDGGCSGKKGGDGACCSDGTGRCVDCHFDHEEKHAFRHLPAAAAMRLQREHAVLRAAKRAGRLTDRMLEAHARREDALFARHLPAGLAAEYRRDHARVAGLQLGTFDGGLASLWGDVPVIDPLFVSENPDCTNAVCQGGCGDGEECGGEPAGCCECRDGTCQVTNAAVVVVDDRPDDEDEDEGPFDDFMDEMLRDSAEQSGQIGGGPAEGNLGDYDGGTDDEPPEDPREANIPEPFDPLDLKTHNFEFGGIDDVKDMNVPTVIEPDAAAKVENETTRDWLNDFEKQWNVAQASAPECNPTPDVFCDQPPTFGCAQVVAWIDTYIDVDEDGDPVLDEFGDEVEVEICNAMGLCPTTCEDGTPGDAQQVDLSAHCVGYWLCENII